MFCAIGVKTKIEAARERRQLVPQSTIQKIKNYGQKLLGSP